MQSIGVRSTAKGPINHKVGAPPPLGFPHTMLSVDWVKDNVRLLFIEKLFTNCEIETNVQTKLYENESYLCDVATLALGS